jgi:hypothetical protein
MVRAQNEITRKTPNTAARLRARNLVGERWRKCRVRDQRQERAVLANSHHLQEALAWILFRHPDNDAKETGELVRSTACLHQARAIDHGRLSSRLGQLTNSMIWSWVGDSVKKRVESEYDKLLS